MGRSPLGTRDRESQAAVLGSESLDASPQAPRYASENTMSVTLWRLTQDIES